MKFITQNNNMDLSSKTIGMSLRGHIECDYKVLKGLLGMPTTGGGYKVDAEWVIKFEDGTLARIYNYKDGKNYLGNEGLPKTKITDWHIGGFDEKSVEMVNLLLA